jgi:hypothetical protein
MSYQMAGTTYAMSVRVIELDHGSQMISDEDQARTRRAYYPHQLSASPFTLTLVINGYNERIAFSNFLNDYANRVLDPALSVTFPTMYVTLPSRNFVRWGVPKTGIEWGDHVGSMIWNPAVTFETHIDQSIGDTMNSPSSTFQLSSSATDVSPELKYFYPAGIQLSGDQVPAAGDYTVQIDPQTIQNIINGGTTGPSGGDTPLGPEDGYNYSTQGPYAYLTNNG